MEGGDKKENGKHLKKFPKFGTHILGIQRNIKGLADTFQQGGVEGKDAWKIGYAKFDFNKTRYLYDL